MTTPVVTVYTTPSCSQCNLTKSWLDDPKRGNLKGKYSVVDLTTDPQAYAAVKALGYASAPVVIVNDNGDTKDEKHWYGFRPDMLEQYCKAPAAAVPTGGAWPAHHIVGPDNNPPGSSSTSNS